MASLRLQPADDLVGRDVALVARLQGDEEAPVVLRLGAAGADRHADRGDGGILAHHLAEGALAADHLGEGDVLGRLRGADDEARILLRKEALGNDDEEIAGRDQSGEKDGEGDAVVAKGDIEPAAVAGEQDIEPPLREHIETPMPYLPIGPHEPGAHHRGQGQRDHGRDGDGHGDGDAEFAKQPPDDPAHEQQRNEDGDERQADGDDGEADLARTLDGGFLRRQPVLDMAMDVLEHHDRIVDHEADGDGKGHQGEIVEAVAQQIHDREGADERQRHGDARDHRRPEAAQEDEDHHDDQERS